MTPGDILEFAKAIGVPGVLAYLFVREFRAYAKERDVAKRGNGEDPADGGMMTQLFFKKMTDCLEANTRALTQCADGLEKVLEHQAAEDIILRDIQNRLDN